MSVARSPFGRTPDGRSVERFRLMNAGGVEAQLMSYGGAVVSLRVPDRWGRLGDVVLGFDDLEGYVGSAHYSGAIIGRYANRIAHGRFALDGRSVALAANDGPHHLHGGRRGFDKVVWEAEPFEGPDGAGVTFSYTSPDGEEGYPGRLAVGVTYILTATNELVFDCRATTDTPTPVNLVQHNYYNLAGDGAADVLAHELRVCADLYLPVDATLIPTGALAAVDGTPFDFREPVPIGARISQEHEQLANGRGYDHTFVLRRSREGLVAAARVFEPTTGRVLEVATTEPGLHFYSGNRLDGRTGKAGRAHRPRAALCLETQHYPDSPNQSCFPSSILRPGQEYRSRTVFAFSVVT